MQNNQLKISLAGCPSLGEMALAYYGGRYEQKTAIKHFKEDIDADMSLSADLEAAGYRKWEHHFKPQQVLVVFDHWEEPDAVNRRKAL